MKPIVYIVHHVDTEGPLYEDIKETFKRLEDILHIKLNIKPTQANLNKLRNGEIDGISEDLTEKIRIIANPHLLNYKNHGEKLMRCFIEYCHLILEINIRIVSEMDGYLIGM